MSHQTADLGWTERPALTDRVLSLRFIWARGSDHIDVFRDGWREPVATIDVDQMPWREGPFHSTCVKWLCEVGW